MLLLRAALPDVQVILGACRAARKAMT